MTQQKIYRALSQAEGYLSGEALSRELGITRAAVWKAVKSLQRQGYDIEAVSGLGYRLQGEGPLRPEDIRRALPYSREHLHVLETVDSTNSQCRRMAAEGAPDGTVVIAQRQTAGRGRRGRSFESPPGLGLYLSILWRPRCQVRTLLPLTALCAVAAARALERSCGAPCQIKWPNDLVLHGKKLAGILTEMSVEGESGAVDYVIVGIGINVGHRPEDFSPEVAALATSLAQELEAAPRRSELAAALIEELDTLRRDILPHPGLWLADYRAGCLNLGKPVQLLYPDGSRRSGRALAVDEDFGLTVEFPDGTEETVRSGEVSVRGLYGYAE